MKNLLILIKQQIYNIHIKKGKKYTIPVYFLTFFASVFIISAYTINIFKVFNKDTYHYALYMVSFIAAFLTITTSFTIKGHLFGFKDFDLLMSLPIKKEEIIISKFVSFLFSELLAVVMVTFPTLILYGIYTNSGIFYYILSLVGMLIMPLFFISIAVIIMFLLKKTILKGKRKDILAGILTLVFLGIYFYFIFNANTQGLYFFEKSKGILEIISKCLFVIDFYVEGIIYSNIVLWLLSCIISISLMLLTFKIFSKQFILMNLETYTTTSKKLNDNDIKVYNLKKLLIKKEFLRIFSNLQYTINMGSGIVAQVFVVAMIIIDPNKISYFTNINTNFNLLLLMLCFIGFTIHTNLFSAVSLSLEGKNIWLLKSLPISFKDLMFSKFIVNFILCFIPSIISITILSIILKFPIYYILIGIFYALLASHFASLSGLFLNILFPKYDFDREIVVIKRSMSSFLSFIINISICLLMIFFVIRVNSEITFIIIILLYLLLNLLLLMYFKFFAKKRFYSTN